MKDILDFSTPDEKSTRDFSAIVQWWERKRIIYNIIMLICGMINLLLANTFTVPLIFLVLMYAILANLFYCAGIMIEAWDNYYFKGRLQTGTYRVALFVLGTLISAFITILIDPIMFLY